MGLTKVSYAMINGAPVNFLSYGAVGDGVTDDTAAVQAALNSGAPIVDGSGLTYNISSTLTGQAEQIVRNATFTSSTLASSTAMLSFSGTQGTAISVSSDVSAGSFSITVSNGSTFAADGWVFIKSNLLWSPSDLDNVTVGELLQVESVVGNVLTLHTPTLAAYAVADSATVAPLTTAKNIVLQDLNFIGPVSTGNQTGVSFTYCENVEVRNCHTYDFDYSHLIFTRCVNYTVRGGSSSKTGVQEGLDYGVVHASGSYNGLVDGYTANSMRHISTIGGAEGVCRFIRVVNCFGYNLTDGGIDSHSACYEHDFSHNFLLFSNSSDTTIDGIVSQGGMLTCIGNTVLGARRHGVIFQPSISNSITINNPIGCVINKNVITGNYLSGTTYAAGISVPSSGSALKPTTSVVISGNAAKGFSTMILVGANGSKISNVVIDSNVCQEAMTSRGAYVYAQGNDIDNVVISNNIFTSTSAEVVYCIGASPNSVNNVNVANNVINNGTYGLRVLHGTQITATGNQFYNNATARYLIDDATCLQVYLDRLVDNWHSVTGSSYTVADDILNIVCSYAGTVTITLPDVDTWLGRSINIKTTTANTVVSASSNVVTLPNTTAGTAILAATDGAWVTLQSDGTNWVAMQGTL